LIGPVARLPLYLLLALVATGPLGALDLSKPPNPAEIRALDPKTYPAVARKISETLMAAYVPGERGRPGISGTTAFAAWLDFYRGCELMARPAENETIPLVRRHFFRERAAGKIFYLETGQVVPDALETLSDPDLAALAKHQNVRAQLESAALPTDSKLPDGTLGEIVGRNFSGEFLSNPAYLAAFFSTISDRDYTPLVLKNLREIREAHPAKWREYQNLAIALAMVNDSPLPAFWPHIQVTPSLVPKEIPPVATQFSRWVDANESGKLELDLRKLPSDQLKFVIDAFVSESEIDWARKNVRHPRSKFDRAFSEVAYQPDRIKNKRFFWKASPYTLENIRRMGGICVDQAYYAMIAGKAHGLPTLFFTGQGKDGGHAWFGYLRREDKWELDVGRYSQQNYAVGQALDPQTWQPISDHQLQLLAARFRDKPEFAASMNDLAMAAIFEKNGDAVRADAAYTSAVQTCPKNPDAWEQRGEFLARTNAPLEQRRQFHEEAIRRLGSSPDLKVRHQTALANLHRESGDQSSANKVERAIVTQNRNHRTDLSVGIAAQKVNAAIASGDLDAAASEFHKQLHSIGENAGGDFVKQVGVPFLEALMKSGQNARARRAIGTMRQQLTPEPGSLLDIALRELELSTKNRTKVQ
jgi:Flp pilus assembly protein TadD